MERKKTGRKRKSTSNLPSINVDFTPTEFEDLSEHRESLGLNWHDYILVLKDDFDDETPTEKLR